MANLVFFLLKGSIALFSQNLRSLGLMTVKPLARLPTTNQTTPTQTQHLMSVLDFLKVKPLAIIKMMKVMRKVVARAVMRTILSAMLD